MANLSKVAQKITEKYMDKLRAIEEKEMRTIELLYKSTLKEADLENIDNLKLLFTRFAGEAGLYLKANQWLCLELGLISANLMMSLSAYKWKPIGDGNIRTVSGMKGNRQKDITIELQERIDRILRVVDRLIKAKVEKEIIIKVLDRIPAETLRIARSEQMRAFREAQRKQLEA
jgi:hypothetical protein